jgi:transposase
MDKVHIIGFDLAKQVFQAHGADASGETLLRRKLRRAEVLPFFRKLPSCIVAMEACGGAHHWAREISALGHEVRLVPPAYVKPFVKRGKTDAADAEAISEAAVRKSMRFVPVKSAEQQASAMVLKSRALLVRQQTQLINALRGHLSELGIVATVGMRGLAIMIAMLRDEADLRIPRRARLALSELADQIDMIGLQIRKLERGLVEQVKEDDDLRRLTTIPGVGVMIAASIKAHVPDVEGFKSGRHFAAWLGLTPKPCSSGGKERLGGISKMGNPMLRSLLVLGAASVLRRVKANEGGPSWLVALLGRRPFKVVAVALANKMARMIWALLSKGGVYQADRVFANSAAA